MACKHNAFGSYGKVHGLYAQHEGDEGWQEGSDLKGEEGGPPCLRGAQVIWYVDPECGDGTQQGHWDRQDVHLCIAVFAHGHWLAGCRQAQRMSDACP